MENGRDKQVHSRKGASNTIYGVGNFENHGDLLQPIQVPLGRV